MNERDFATEYLRAFSSTSFSSQMHFEVAQYFMKKQVYEKALMHFLVVSPLPVQEILQVSSILGNVDVYLSTVFENIQDVEEQVRSIQKLCTHLKTGAKEEIEKAAMIYVCLFVVD